MEVKTFWGILGENILVGGNPVLQRKLTETPPMNVILWNAHVVQQRFPGLAFVGFWIVDGNVAFVAEEDVHPVPVHHRSGKRIALGESGLVERQNILQRPDACATAGQHNTCVTIAASLGVNDEIPRAKCRFAGEFRTVSYGNNSGGHR